MTNMWGLGTRSLVVGSAAMAAIAMGCVDAVPDGEERVSSVTQAVGEGAQFEVWLVDQSNSFGKTYGGAIHIFDGTDLMGENAASATPAQTLDLAGATAALCLASTGANPVRPHMILFNSTHSHAVLSFVASGHVVIYDAVTRAPLSCMRASVGAGGARQAHAAFPAEDDSYILVANQNGKLLERIDTNYATNSFVWNHSATLNLATCTTPGGAPCQSATLRPDNAPICPIIDKGSRFGFITLRGGGLFVVNPRTSPMSIVAEYDNGAVHGNGCGGIDVGDRMFINSGGGTAANLFQYDLYSFSLSALGSAPVHPVNTPGPTLLYSDNSEERDAHGMVTSKHDNYLWMFDRGTHSVDIFDTATGGHVTNLELHDGDVEPTPDLVDISPAGNRMFVSLRGPTPLSGDPHVSQGSVPGMAIVQVTNGGAAGTLKAIVPISNVDAGGVERADAHGIRVRLK